MVIIHDPSLPASTALISSVLPWEFTRGSTWDTSSTRFDTNTSALTCTSFYHYRCRPLQNIFKVLRLHLWFLNRGKKKISLGEGFRTIGHTSALLDSHAELIALPKHSCLNHVSRRLLATGNENSLPYTSKSGNQKRHQISPHSVLFLPRHSWETWFKMLHSGEIGDEMVTRVERCLAWGQLYVFQNKVKKVKPKSKQWLSFLYNGDRELFSA